MKHLPNMVSALRLVMTPYVCWLIWWREYDWVLAWFAVAAATDALDGASARWLKVESKLGEVLDPIADKVLLTAVYIFLSLAGAVPWWLTGMVLGRDVLLLAGAGVLLAMGRRQRFPPSVWGKVSTIVQMFYVLAVVASGGAHAMVPGYAVAGLAVISGVDYARRLVSKG